MAVGQSRAVTGNSASSSTTPQGRDQFCDARQPAGSPGFCGAPGVDASLYNITLNNGAVPGTWNPNDPAASNYHTFGNPDRLNYSPDNLLLTPSQGKSIFTNLTYQANDYVEVLHEGTVHHPQLGEPGGARAHRRRSVGGHRWPGG